MIPVAGRIQNKALFEVAWFGSVQRGALKLGICLPHPLRLIAELTGCPDLALVYLCAAAIYTGRRAGDAISSRQRPG